MERFLGDYLRSTNLSDVRFNNQTTYLVKRTEIAPALQNECLEVIFSKTFRILSSLDYHRLSSSMFAGRSQGFRSFSAREEMNEYMRRTSIGFQALRP